MRVLCLDFDGVLHPVSAVKDWARDGRTLQELRYAPDKQLFRWLDRLVQMLDQHPDVAILVHSGWRTMSRDFELREYLGPLADRFIGSTSKSMQRFAGITHVMSRIGTTDYVIIDDATHEFPDGLPELIATDPELGLSEPGIQTRLQAWLDNPKDDLATHDEFVASSTPSC